jgi:DNA-directed RNA polymerase subunit beta'
MERVEKLSPDQEVDIRGPHIMTSCRDVLYTNHWVYDVKTRSGLFVASGLLNHNSGGLFEGREAQEKSISGGGLDRALTILHMPKKVKGSAKLSTASGKVGAIKKDPAGGVNVTIGDTSHYIPADRNVLTKMKRGATVKKGDPITAGPINPHELLPLTNMNKVQGYLASELHSIYAPEGIRRRNSEVIVRSLSNVTKVENPGDNDDFIVGDFAPTSVVNDWNKKNRKLGRLPVRHSPVLRGVKQIPLDVQTDWLARLNHENLRGTIVEAAQQGWASQLHGDHPIPPLIYGAEFGKGTKKKPWSY